MKPPADLGGSIEGGASAPPSTLPDPGAGFVWDEVPPTVVLRPATTLARAAFTTRLGGVNAPPRGGLNVSGQLAGDLTDVFMANRDIAGRTVGGNEKWKTKRQVHGSVVAKAATRGTPKEADAIWTDEPGYTIAVVVADCVPVLLAARGKIAAAHVGWRGCVARIVENAARAIDASEAFAGPAIGPCCFEVGPEVIAQFQATFGDASVADDRHVDLWTAVELAAKSAGVRTVNSARVCTSCNPELFYSHRRDQGRTGRQALVARLP